MKLKIIGEILIADEDAEPGEMFPEVTPVTGVFIECTIDECQSISSLFMREVAITAIKRTDDE